MTLDQATKALTEAEDELVRAAEDYAGILQERFKTDRDARRELAAGRGLYQTLAVCSMYLHRCAAMHGEALRTRTEEYNRALNDYQCALYLDMPMPPKESP